MEKLKNYINGKLILPISRQYIENVNPATGEVYSLIPNSDERDLALAVEAAKGAFTSWASTSQQERSKLLVQIATLIEKYSEKLALAESIDNGKPLSLAKTMDIPRAAANFHFYGTAILHEFSESHFTNPIAINYTLRKPLGIVGCISPWNLPLYLFTWKIAPALATGNCVIAKPSEITPMTAYLLSQICIEAGLPKGVLNIVHGYGHKIGQAIAEHPEIPAISFTGGTATGKKIALAGASLFKKISLELGGKNPNIIFADANFENALATSLRSSFANQGQICLCGSRILIQKSIYEQFRDEFVKKVKQLNVGDPLEESTDLGAVVSKAHQEKVLSYIALAQEEGGEILTGGKAISLSGRCKNGFFIAPTVIEGLSADCRTNQEEIFGPVVTLIPFGSREEAVALANCTPYGLAAMIWTENLTTAHYVAHHLQSGIIWINCWLLRDLRTPFGGMKNSGLGREGGFEALRFFTEEKNICIKL
ncbi:aldehyde dehydrogenase [Thermoflexibacter ruber]|uniref:Aminomuconate-semialdehyde/2-hydroxymuconate-6-semialdehyde dehydrogenase n=1 Tax=Thermoflexibacter ruber TaxID=1003 RepID=A0A1I2ADH6_9BACT|nr:aldehyde dehydrogenase [Thermoflexibacter ruber]SFE42055.1 aminomuconate-semialdehyde/2-hydroxymuconate-6-semialdehyde dehydrogenase [Thermoflexibacter ruber]